MNLPVDSINLALYSQSDLIRLRERIEKELPSTSSLDLQAELVFQFLGAKNLLAQAQDDSDIALNQKAQIVNSVAALLKQLAATQIELFSAERNRIVEMSLIECLKAYPELHTSFLEEYASRLEGIK